MSSFQEHFERGEQALSKFENAKAQAALDSALALAKAPYERAMALTGLATICFRNKEDERAIDLLDQAIADCLPVLDGKATNESRTARALAEAWFEKGIVLTSTGRDQEALETFNESLDRFLDGVSVATPHGEDANQLRRVIVKTLRFRGATLASLERDAEALACYEDLIRRFQDIADARVQRFVARAMHRRAVLFGDLGRQDKEIAGYDEVIARFGTRHDLDIVEIVLDSFENKMAIYRDQEDLQTVIEICDDIIRRYGTEKHWRVADTVARTMIRQAVALSKIGEHNRELASYDEVVRLYGDSSEPMLRIHGAKALMFKGVTLSDADETSAEIECYDEVLRRYADDDDREVRVVAADALIHKGLSLGAIAEDAAEDTGVREIEAEIACYDEVLDRYGEEEFIGMRRAVAEALLHKSETLMEAGRTGEATVCLDSLIAAYAALEDQDLRDVVKDARDLRAQL